MFRVRELASIKEKSEDFVGPGGSFFKISANLDVRGFIFVKIFGRLRRPFFHSIFNVFPLYTVKKPFFSRASRAILEFAYRFPPAYGPKTRFFSRASREILEFVHVFPPYMVQNLIFSRASRGNLRFFSASPPNFGRGVLF